MVYDLKGLDWRTDCQCVRVTGRLWVTASVCGPETEDHLGQLSVNMTACVGAHVVESACGCASVGFCVSLNVQFLVRDWVACLCVRGPVTIWGLGLGKVSVGFKTVCACVRVGAWVCVCHCVTSAWQGESERLVLRACPVSCVLCQTV